MTRRVVNMFVDGRKNRGRPKKRWMDFVNEDMRVISECRMTADGSL